MNAWTLVLSLSILATPNLAAAEEPGQWLVGVLTLQHTEQCNGRWESQWVNPHHEVGFVRVQPAKGVDLEALEGRLVMVRGVLAPPPVVLVQHTGECPARQARDDWVFAKRGVRLLRTWPEALPRAFTALEVRPFDGLKVIRTEDGLRMTFTNPRKDLPLDSVEITVHYEGCYGKPNTRTQHAKIGRVEPDTSVSADFPLLVEDESARQGRTTHRPWSIQVSSLTPGVYFAVDAPLRLFEAGEVLCPPRN